TTLHGVTHGHQTPVGARDTALDEEHVLLGHHLDDGEVLDGHARVAVLAGHSLALHDAAGRGRLADRATVAEELVDTVRGLGARHVVSLHDAGEATAFGGTCHVDQLASVED